MHSKNTMLGRLLLSGSSRQQYVDRGLSQFILRLVNGRQRRMSNRRHFDIVEANHRYIFRNLHAQLNCRFKDAKRHGVVRGEDCCDVTAVRKHFPRYVISALKGMSPMQDRDCGILARLSEKLKESLGAPR